MFHWNEDVDDGSRGYVIRCYVLTSAMRVTHVFIVVVDKMCSTGTGIL